MTLGERIKSIRLERGIKRATLALDAEYTAPGMYKIEWGITDPRLSSILRIATALDMTLSELLEGVDHA